MSETCKEAHFVTTTMQFTHSNKKEGKKKWKEDEKIFTDHLRLTILLPLTIFLILENFLIYYLKTQTKVHVISTSNQKKGNTFNKNENSK